MEPQWYNGVPVTYGISDGFVDLFKNAWVVMCVGVNVCVLCVRRVCVTHMNKYDNRTHLRR